MDAFGKKREGSLPPKAARLAGPQKRNEKPRVSNQVEEQKAVEILEPQKQEKQSESNSKESEYAGLTPIHRHNNRTAEIFGFEFSITLFGIAVVLLGFLDLSTIR